MYLFNGICLTDNLVKNLHRETNVTGLPISTQMTFQRFIFVLAAKYSEIKTVEGYASFIGITSKHLNSVCRNHTGSSAKTIIDNTIISHIKGELNSSDKTVSEISYQIGFKEPTEMSRFFRRIEGITPSQWRESQKSDYKP